MTCRSAQPLRIPAGETESAERPRVRPRNVLQRAREPDAAWVASGSPRRRSSEHTTAVRAGSRWASSAASARATTVTPQRQASPRRTPPGVLRPVRCPPRQAPEWRNRGRRTRPRRRPSREIPRGPLPRKHLDPNSRVVASRSLHLGGSRQLEPPAQRGKERRRTQADRDLAALNRDPARARASTRAGPRARPPAHPVPRQAPAPRPRPRYQRARSRNRRQHLRDGERNDKKQREKWRAARRPPDRPPLSGWHSPSSATAERCRRTDGYGTAPGVEQDGQAEPDADPGPARRATERSCSSEFGSALRAARAGCADQVSAGRCTSRVGAEPQSVARQDELPRDRRRQQHHRHDRNGLHRGLAGFRAVREHGPTVPHRHTEQRARVYEAVTALNRGGVGLGGQREDQRDEARRSERRRG